MKALKLVAISYLIKTLLVGIAWFFIPDLPQRASTFVRRACGFVDPAPASAEPAPPEAPVAAAVPASIQPTR